VGEVFLAGEALAAKRVSRHELRRWHTPIYRGVYVPKGADVPLKDRAVGAWLASGRRGVIAGVAASALHGASWVDATHPVELLRVKCTPQPGLVPRLESVADDEVTRVSGIPVTTRVRTAFDLGRHQRRLEALARLDALMWTQRFSADEVLALGVRYPGARGIRQLRELLPLVDGGAASPRETWLRLLFIDAGLPWPTTQIPACDDRGNLVRTLDMGWEEFKVGAEYDGEQHRTDRRQYVKDARVKRALVSGGWKVDYVIKEDQPTDIVARARRALMSRGWRDPKRS
jgi:hypothetical protein